MFDKHACNMTNTESYIRAFISIFLFFLAYEFDSIILILISLILLHSAITKFCFMYHLFHINDKFSTENYYLSLLPKYTSTPTFIFNEEGKLLFRNDSAEKILPFINTIKDCYQKQIFYIIENNLDVIDYFESEYSTYQIELQGVKKEKLVLIHFYDVTKLIRLRQDIEDTQREVIYAMGEIGESRSKETGKHVKRVALYSHKLARLANLSKEESNVLQMASPMHDIGKVGIADSILNAPRKLSDEEFEIMKTHAEIGYNLLKNSKKKILQAAAIVAREHHEKYDGTGYPRQLKGDKIHIYGRITAIADVFDALINDRLYKTAWKEEKIINYFNEQKGKHFDPELVSLFLKHFDEFIAIQKKFSD